MLRAGSSAAQHVRDGRVEARTAGDLAPGVAQGHRPDRDSALVQRDRAIGIAACADPPGTGSAG